MGRRAAFAPSVSLSSCGGCVSSVGVCGRRGLRRGVSAPAAPPVRVCAWRMSETGESAGRRARRWGLSVLAAVALATGGVGRGACAASDARSVAAPGVTKELRYDGRTELGGTEKMLSLVLTGGAFAGLSLWAWRRNRLDDELEQIRIKEEVERLEKLKAEFMDVEEDDDSLDDEDLLKELNKRIEKDSGADEEGEGGETVGSGATATTSENRTGETDGDGGSESLDMLRRMWEATDDEKKDGGGSSAPATGQ